MGWLLFVDVVVVDLVDVVEAPVAEGMSEVEIEIGIRFVWVGWADDVWIVVVFETITLFEGM